VIRVRKATHADVPGICRVCAEAWRTAYRDLLVPDIIERVIAQFYNPERIWSEVSNPVDWNGWWVAEEDGVVVGAGGGGLLAPGVGALYVLHVDPARWGQGVGTLLLKAITDELKQQGAQEQWVSVIPGNQKGIRFYEARGFVKPGEHPLDGSVPDQQFNSSQMRRTI
jgi:GNAT superfamily N-acetyltransferase